MAIPQIGLGAGYHASTEGNIRIAVDVTGITSPDLSATAVFSHSVAAGRPIAEALPDILAFVGIRPPYTNAADNTSKIKVQVDGDGDGTVDNDVTDISKTWREVGIAGDVALLADKSVALVANVAILDA